MELQYLKRHGVSCTLNRDTPVSAAVSLKQTTRGTNFGLRESAHEGWIDQSVTVGETFTVDDTYLIYSVNSLRRVYSFIAMKCNSVITVSTLTVGEDSYGNPTEEFEPVATDQDVYGQIINASLRATDPGLLPTTTRVYTMPASISVSVLDRVTHGSEKFRVDCIDDILIAGLKRIQVSPDTRED